MLREHAVQILFALAFFVCRVALGPFVVYYTLQSATSHPVVKVRSHRPPPPPMFPPINCTPLPRCRSPVSKT